MDEKTSDAPRREYHPRQCFIPQESREGRLVTSDGQVYWRDPRTQVIRAQSPKVRGKAARAAEKQVRRALRAARDRSPRVDDPPAS